MKSAINRIYEADLAFAAPGTTATATGIVGEVPLDKLVKLRPGDQRNRLGAESYAVVIAVSAIDFGDGDETYTFTAETGVAGAPAVKVGEVAVNGTGQFILALDADTIEALDPDHEAIELNLTVAGAVDQSITFGAWLAPK